MKIYATEIDAPALTQARTRVSSAHQTVSLSSELRPMIDSAYAQRRKELRRTREKLQTNTEELESTNDEAQVHNDELRSANKALIELGDDAQRRSDRLDRGAQTAKEALVQLAVALEELRVVGEQWSADLDEAERMAASDSEGEVDCRVATCAR